MNLTDAEEMRLLLERHGFRFSRSMSQNFLTERWVPERMAESAGLDAASGALEVGPGVGCLTAELSRRSGRVCAVELDRSLRGVLEETLADCGNVELVFGDVLRMDLCKLAAEKLPGLRPVACANLPYNVTSPLIAKFIDAGCFDTMVFMVQREVAERLSAAPGTAEYSAFTIYVNWYCRTETLCDVPPTCFMPRPKVTSSVIRLTRRDAPPAPTADEALLWRTVRAAFCERRKTLRNALANGFPALGKERAAAALAETGLPPEIRGEALSPEQFALLADALKKSTETP